MVTKLNNAYKPLSVCFILIQLNVQYFLFLKILLAQHVSDVTASIVRSTTVVYSYRRFGFWCVYSMGLVVVLGNIVTVSRSVSDSETDRDIVTMYYACYRFRPILWPFSGRCITTDISQRFMNLPEVKLMCVQTYCFHLRLGTYCIRQACQTEGPPRATWVTFVLS
jgi:hypothetical protein